MTATFFRKARALAAAVLMGLALASGTCTAADPAPAAQPPREAAPTAMDPQAHKRVLAISEQLRCLVCQNQSIADSNADLARDLRGQVIEQIRAGRTDREIIDYMVDRYGDFVLYKPPFKASTVILWLGPAVLFFGAALWFWISLRRRRALVRQSSGRLTPDERIRARELLEKEP